jgi:hypothetical protein
MELHFIRSRLAAKKIIADIKDRSGLGDEWYSIDKAIQMEILDEWTSIIASCLPEDK